MGKEAGPHTNITLRNPSHRIQIIAANSIPVYPANTIRVYVCLDTEHLQGSFDEACEPQREEYECSDEDYSW